MGVVKDLPKAARVEAGRSDDFGGVVTSVDESSEAIFLQVIEPRSTLNIGEAFRVLVLKDLEPLPAHQDELQIATQFLMVQLGAPEEISHLMVDVIQDLNFG